MSELRSSHPAFRPFLGAGAGMMAITAHPVSDLESAKTNYHPMLELGVGVEGGTGFRPSVQWRWRWALGNVGVMDGGYFDYHSLSFGFVLNGGSR